MFDRLIRGSLVPEGMPEMFSGTVPPDQGDPQLTTVKRHRPEHHGTKHHRRPNRSPAHLSHHQRHLARRAAVGAMRVLLNHAPEVHYSQGATRWQGITEHLLAKDGRYPTALDCSAACTWALWNGLGSEIHRPDVVNGEHWRAGYTGTMIDHGLVIALDRPRLWMPGDCVIYGASAEATEHVAMIIGWDKRYRSHMVISQGSEPGPFYLKWNYRPDAVGCRRYI